MSNEHALRSRLVPAICTQCGGQVQVDPSQEAAVCQYCGTPFIVEKAIQNYSIQNAKIEHVDTVNINTKSTAESFFSFLGKQMSESREVRREERREQRAADREQQKLFLRYTLEVMRGCFLASAAGLPYSIGSGDEKFDAMFPRMVTANNIEAISEAISEATYAIERNAYGKIALMELSFRMSKALKKR
jgi:hypothetical protein